MLNLPNYASSDEFDARERAVLDLAVAMAQTPAEIPAEVRDAAAEWFDEAQMVELCTAIAWEHFRSRLNRALGVQPAGFSEGAFCVLPEAPR